MQQKWIEEINILVQKAGFFVIEVKENERTINVCIDAIRSVSLQDCAEVSRKIHEHFPELAEEYALQVQSYGITGVFLRLEHYIKNIGRLILIKTKTGEKLQALIVEVKGEEVHILPITSTKKPSAEEPVVLNVGEIAYAKLVLKF